MLSSILLLAWCNKNKSISDFSIFIFEISSSIHSETFLTANLKTSCPFIDTNVFLELFISLYCIEFSHVNAPPIEPSECITVSNLAFSSFLIIAAPAPSPKRIAVVLSVQSTICDKPSAPMTNAVSTKPAFM